MPDPRPAGLSRLTTALVRSTDRRTRLSGALGPFLGILAVGVVTVVDLATGPHVSLLFGYAMVVLAAGWWSNRGTAVGLAVLAAVGTIWAASADPDNLASSAVIALNAGLRATLLVALGIGSWLLHATLLELGAVARRDSLTGLFNRSAVFEIAERERLRSLRSGRPLSVAYFDLDGLKQVNDREGHDAGDAMIMSFARALDGGLRATDVAARLGGDEFVVVLPDADETVARLAIERVLQAGPAASCGLVAFMRPEAHVSQLVAAADSLMYETKRAGGGLRSRTDAAPTRSGRVTP